MSQTLLLTRPKNIRALRMFYFMTGLGVSAWAITVPFTKIRFALNDATLGLILLAPGFGGILAMPLAGYLAGKFGSKTILLLCGLMFGITLPLLTVAPNVPVFTVALFVYGVVFAGLDIAMNGQAVVMENHAKRLLMSSFHALFSIGSLVVAVATSLLLKLGLSNAICAILTGAVILCILSQGGLLLPKSQDLPSDGPAFALPNRKTIALGLCCFACFLTEGAVTDWSTIFMHFSRGINLSSAPFGYAGFAVMMAVSRLGGDRVATRLGQAKVMRLGSILAGLGMLLAVSIPNFVTGILGFALVGLGIGNIAPLVFSAAARVPGMSPNVSTPAVVSLGYAGFLLGPVIIGFIANEISLSVSLGLVAAMLFLLSLAAHTVAPQAE